MMGFLQSHELLSNQKKISPKFDKLNVQLLGLQYHFCSSPFVLRIGKEKKRIENNSSICFFIA